MAQLQAAAAARPVHAYLLVGPEGSGKRAAARAFAALLLSADATGADRQRHIHLALSEAHPDLRIVEPQGNTVRTEEAQAIVRAATRSPTEGWRKVVLATGFELLEPKTAGMLLKIIEEPSPSTTFVLTSERAEPGLGDDRQPLRDRELRPCAGGSDRGPAQGRGCCTGAGSGRGRHLGRGPVPCPSLGR